MTVTHMAAARATNAEKTLRQVLPSAWFDAMENERCTDLDIDEHGRLWAKVAGEYQHLGAIDRGSAHTIASVLSSWHGVPLNENRQSLKTTWPGNGFRTVVQIPEAVLAPTVHVRTTYGSDLDLRDLVESCTLTATQAVHLEGELYAHHNVIICGLPGSGKTTLQRALTKVLARMPWIVVLVDALDEVKTEAALIRRVHPNAGYSDADALDDSLLKDPGAIAYGEVRSGTTGIALVRTWLSGTCGGYCTCHTDDAAGVIVRFADFYRENRLDPVYADLGRVIHTIVHMRATREGDVVRYVADEVVRVTMKTDTPMSPADFELIPVA